MRKGFLTYEEMCTISPYTLWGGRIYEEIYFLFYQFPSSPWTHSFGFFCSTFEPKVGDLRTSWAESDKILAFLKSRWLHTLTFTLGSKELRILHLGHQTSTKHMLLTATKTMHSWRTFNAQYPLQRLSSKTLCQQPLTEPRRSWQGTLSSVYKITGPPPQLRADNWWQLRTGLSF